MNYLLSFLKKEQLRIELSYNIKKTAFYIFLLVFMFLFFFKPYFLNTCKSELSWIVITGYSICSSIGYYVNALIHRSHSKKKWTKKDEILLIATTIITNWIACYFFNLALNTTKYSIAIPDFFSFNGIMFAITLGVLVYAILRLYDLSYFILIHHKKNPYDSIFYKYEKFNKNLAVIRFSGRNNGEQLELAHNQLVYIKSEGHYAKIYYIASKTKSIDHVILRSSMKEIENTTILFPNIYRCHKSYFINIDYIQHIIAKPRSYAYLKRDFGKIPISKNKISIIQERIRLSK